MKDDFFLFEAILFSVYEEISKIIATGMFNSAVGSCNNNVKSTWAWFSKNC